ncbi:hypothetical protein MnTg02_01979 [bacterium MnTg02]|nr:hypothetical protein MnTg02_01979 [bacterium MnTg02]
MRQEIAGLIKNIDAQFVIVNADMNMHSADNHAPGDEL